MWANNEIGTVSDVAALAETAHAVGVPFHTDAVQAVGAGAVDFAACGADALTMTAHKLGGPMGAGALLLRREADCTPLLHGGGQERDVRSGTLDVAAIVGLAVAASAAVGSRAERAGWRRSTRPPGGRRGGRGARRPAQRRPAGRRPGRARPAAGNAHLSFPGAEGDALLMLLDARGSSAPPGPPAAPASPGPATCCWRRVRRRPGSQLAAVQPGSHLDRRGRRRRPGVIGRWSSARAGPGWARDEGPGRDERGRGLGGGRRSGGRCRPRRDRCAPRALPGPPDAAQAGPRLLQRRGRPRRPPGGRRAGHPVLRGDLADRFREDVVDDFVAEYAAGRTPNPACAATRRSSSPPCSTRPARSGSTPS